MLGASGSWHSRRLLGGFAARGHEVVAIPATRLRSEVDDDGDGARARARRRRARRARPADRPRAPARLARAGDLPDGRAARPRRAAASAASTARARSSGRSTSRGRARCSPLAGRADPADDRLRALRRRDAGVRAARRRRRRQAAVRRDGQRDRARRGPRRGPPGVPRARARAGRLLRPAHGRARRPAGTCACSSSPARWRARWSA